MPNTLSYEVRLGIDAGNYDVAVRGEDDLPDYRDTAKQVEHLLKRAIRNIDSINFDPRKGIFKVYMEFPDGADEEESLYEAGSDLERAFKKIGEGHDHHHFFLYGNMDGARSDFKIGGEASESWESRKARLRGAAMPRTLTASDRSSLIRLASCLPVGTPERKAILAGLVNTSRKGAAKGHRLLRKVNPADFQHLTISASYEGPRGTMWHNDLMKMDPKALDNPAQWTDATMDRFSEKVQRVKGSYISGVKVYGRTHDRKVIPLIGWSRENGFYTDRESERELQRIESEREKAKAKAEAKAEAKARAKEIRLQEAIKREEEREREEERDRMRLPALGHPSHSEPVWSVARSGYDTGEEDDGQYQGYVAEVELFGSKSDAIAYAKDIGGGTVVKGTQMWNEPMGQVEEHGREAWSRYYK